MRVVLFLINNMYVNPQLANYINTRSLIVSQHMSNLTLVCPGGLQVVNTYIFTLRQFVLTIIREIVQALHILHIKLAS